MQTLETILLLFVLFVFNCHTIIIYFYPTDSFSLLTIPCCFWGRQSPTQRWLFFYSRPDGCGCSFLGKLDHSSIAPCKKESHSWKASNSELHLLPSQRRMIQVLSLIPTWGVRELFPTEKAISGHEWTWEERWRAGLRVIPGFRFLPSPPDSAKVEGQYLLRPPSPYTQTSIFLCIPQFQELLGPVLLWASF